MGVIQILSPNFFLISKSIHKVAFTEMNLCCNIVVLENLWFVKIIHK